MVSFSYVGNGLWRRGIPRRPPKSFNVKVMNTSPQSKTHRAAICLAALALLACASSAALAQQAKLINRPLTPSDRTSYKLPATTELSTGLDTVGVGTAIYLEALVVKGTPVNDIAWSLSSVPAGSTAAFAASPLGADIPSWEPAEQMEYDIAGRQVLVPDKNGQYTVVATVTSGTNSLVLSTVFTAANYAGVGLVDGNDVSTGRQCAVCHAGSIADDKVTPWSKTPHASMLTLAIDGLKSDHYSSNCISCHTVGFDTTATAINNGFDDVQKKLGWAFPTNLVAGNWAAMPMDLKQVSNIQCENCHGPGSEHRGGPAKIDVSFSAGTCAVCHSSGSNHIKPQEWVNSKHATAPREESKDCAGCHSGIGFIDRLAGASTVRTNYAAITCVTCHDPHDASNPSQLRSPGVVTLKDTSKAGGATVIASAGKGAMCMQCHMSRRDAATYVTTATPNNRFGPHHGPQADMLAGVNAITYGLSIPSSAHGLVVSNTCVTCHMQTVASTNAAFLKAGGHTFNMSCDTGTNTLDMVAACQGCHGPSATSFDVARVDYDGNGFVEGVQTEVKGLMTQLSMLLPPLGKAKLTVSEVGSGITTNYTTAQRKAVYNLLFVMEDKSYGVHNTAYAVGLLKASIADLGGGSSIGGSVAELNTAIANYFAKSTNYIANPVSLGQGMFQLGVDDNLVGWNLGVQVSSDLTTWTNLPTGAVPVYQFIDPDATNAQMRFYRLRFP